MLLSGLQKQDERDNIVTQFTQSADVDTRVLLFSSVGATGLNMAEANRLIHYDSNWSAVEQDQINGRVWRFGQKHEVEIYHLLALDTADIAMHTLANDKHSLVAGLLTKEGMPSKFLINICCLVLKCAIALEELLDTAKGETESESDSEIVESEDEVPARKRGSKKAVTKTKPKATLRSKKGKGKARETTDDEEDNGGKVDKVKHQSTKTANVSREKAKRAKGGAAGKSKNKPIELHDDSDERPLKRRKQAPPSPQKDMDGDVEMTDDRLESVRVQITPRSVSSAFHHYSA